MNKHCIFCKIIQGRQEHGIFWENRNFIAFADKRPVRQGHVLVVPKKHIDYLFNMPGPLYAELFMVCKQIAVKLKRAYKSKRIFLGVSGFEVPHVHVALVPLNQEMQIKGAKKKALQPNELKLVADRIKKFI